MGFEASTSLGDILDGAIPLAQAVRTRSAWVARTGGWIVLAASVVVGTVIRFDYIFHRPFNSDEAVVGLMAEAVLHGHFTAFYWGQHYGGSLEPVLTAGAFLVFGHSSRVVIGVPAVLAAVAALLTWRIALRVVQHRWVAALAGALVWLAPQAAVSNSTYAWGFRGVTLVCGLTALLAGIRASDRLTVYDSVLLGGSLGVGWWSSPEVIYFGLPALLLAAIGVYRATLQGRAREALQAGGSVVLAAALGALPWIWSNTRSHFASLSLHIKVPPHSPGYVGHLRIFFEYSVAILFSLRDFSGSWLVSPEFGLAVLVLLGVLLVTALAVCVARGGTARILALSVLAFPFLLAVSPSTWFWRDGRYADYVIPLLVLVLAAASDGGSSEQHRARAWRKSDLGAPAFAAVAGVLVALSLTNFQTRVRATTLAKGDPYAAPMSEVRQLEAARISYGYAEYWVAYDLDFLSRERLKIAETNPDRDTSLSRQVLDRPGVAWLFVQNPASAASVLPGWYAGEGPAGSTEAGFLAELRSRGVDFTLEHVGLLDAVIPRSKVTP